MYRNHSRATELNSDGARFQTDSNSKAASFVTGRQFWRNFLRVALIVFICATLTEGFGLRVSAASSDSDEDFSSQPLTPQSAIKVQGSKVGATSSQQTLNLAVSLKVNSQADLDKFLQDLYDPNSPRYHHYLTPAEFTSTFIDSGKRKTVVDFLQSKGLTVKDSGLGSVVDASGSVSQIDAAFNLHISDYKDSTGRVFYSNDFSPALPVSVSSNIQGIIGLSNFAQMQSHLAKQVPGSKSKSTSAQPRDPSGCSEAVAAADYYGSYTPNQFATAYDIDPFYQNHFQGQGQTIALFELDDYTDSDVQTYQTCFGTSVPLQRVLVDESTHTPGDGIGEVELDIEVAAGIAPKLSNLLVYESPVTDTASYIDQYQKIANDNKAQVVSSSWGACEVYATNGGTDLSEVQAENSIFKQFASQGQSFFDAAGDDGSEDCRSGQAANAISVDDPAGQPYVTGVGGTELGINTDNSYQAEIVWNEYSSTGGAGGGGLSGIWAKPSYQASPAITNTYSNGARQVPDVSADADPATGYVVYIQGAFTPIGGTSAAAPLWATVASLTNQYLTSVGKTTLGFVNPSIYQIFGSAPTTFHDITVGDNCYVPASGCGTPNSGSGKYPAKAGYDEASGVGSLDAAKFANAEYQIVGTGPTPTTTTPVPTTTTTPTPTAPGGGNGYVYDLPYLAYGASGFTSYLAFQNIGTGTASFTIRYFDLNGNLVTTPTLTGSCANLVANAECLPTNPFTTGQSGAGIIVSNQPLNVIVAEATPYGGSAYAVSQGSSSSLIAPIILKNAFGDFTTRLTIFNGGSTTAAVTVAFFDQNGNPQPSATQTININPNTSQTLDQAASNLPTSNGGFNGWAQITGPNNGQLVAQILEQSPSQHFVAIANAVGRSFSTLYAPAIFRGAFGFTTGTNIVNPNPNPVTVNITYYEGSGTAYSAPAFQLGANAVASIYQGAAGGVAGLPSAGLATGFHGSATVTTTGGNVVMVVNESAGIVNGISLSGVYSAVGSGSNGVGLPVMANGGFGYTTGATILNTSSNTVSGNIQYYNVDGSLQGGPHPFTIQPHASQLAYQGDPAQGLPSGGSGFYGTAIVTETGGGNDLVITTNAASSLFYTYTEPNQ